MQKKVTHKRPRYLLLLLAVHPRAGKVEDHIDLNMNSV